MLTINIGVPLLVAIIGALVFAISKNGDVKELSKHAFWCGLLVTLFVFATTHVRF
jgi:hypothetical protein